MQSKFSFIPKKAVLHFGANLFLQTVNVLRIHICKTIAFVPEGAEA